MLTRNLDDVFGEDDPERRRAAIEEIFNGGAYSAFRRAGPQTLALSCDGLPGVACNA